MVSIKEHIAFAVALVVGVPQAVLAAQPHGSDANDNGPKTRAEVRQELREWQRNPVSHDGWMVVGDGMIYVGPPNERESNHERLVESEHGDDHDNQSHQPR